MKTARELDITLTPETFDVFKRIPVEWFDEGDAKRAIAAVRNEPVENIARRLAWLVRQGLVERRGAWALTGTTEIRKRAGEGEQ